jgi:hypothetical protein
MELPELITISLAIDPATGRVMVSSSRILREQIPLVNQALLGLSSRMVEMACAPEVKDEPTDSNG